MSLKQTLHALLFSFALAAFVIVPSQETYAIADDWNVVSDYTIRNDGTLKARHTFEIENSTGDPTPQAISLSAFGTDIRAVAAEAQDSTPISAELNQQASTVALQLPDFTGVNREWSFTVSYESNVLVALGETSLLQVEPLLIQGTQIGSQTVDVAIDLELGFAVQQGVKADSSKVGIGSQILSYKSDKGLFTEGLSYYFGEQSLVSATLTANLKNDSLWWQTKQLVLPPDTNQQRAVLKSITPEPSRISLDADGNVIAEYSLSPKREITVIAKVEIGLNNLTYNLESTGTPDQASDILKQRYTALTESWKAGRVEVTINEGASAIEIIRSVSEAVAATVQPGLVASEFNAAMRDGSLGVSDTLVGELRARGVPARIVVGRVLSNGAELFEFPQNHAWVEAYVPESGWITVDPVQMSLTDSFGTADVLHVSFALWGVSDDQPPVDLSKWEYVYIDGSIDDPTVPPVPTISITKTMLFPGVSLRDMKIQMPVGQIVDGVVLRGPNDTNFDYGSLAPLQSASIKTLQFGGAAFSTESFQAGVVGVDEFTKLGGVINSDINYIPMVIVFAVIVAATAVFIVIRRKRQINENALRTKDTFIMHEEKKGTSIESENLLPFDGDDFDSEQSSVQQTKPVAPIAPVASAKKRTMSLEAMQHKTVHRLDVQSPHTANPMPPVAPAAPRHKVKKSIAINQAPQPVSNRTRVTARSLNNDTMSAKPTRKRPDGRKRMIQG